MSTEETKKLLARGPEWTHSKSPDRIALIKRARVLMFNLKKLGIKVDNEYSLLLCKNFVLRLYPYPSVRKNGNNRARGKIESSLYRLVCILHTTRISLMAYHYGNVIAFIRKMDHD